MVDMDEIDHKPKPAAVRSSGDDRAAVAVLAANIEALQEQLAKSEANFTTERSRCDRLLVVVLKATGELMAAKEQLAALKARPWWKRLAG
jgi:arginine/ornithine N-succinyltransferase beta subunit